MKLGFFALIALCAALLSLPASAMPIAPLTTSSDLVLVWHGGHGHHYGWYHGRGHHYGWSRGRHRGWY